MSPAAHELIPTSGEATVPAERALLASGAVAGPFFTISVVLQILTRPGFDIRRHPISLLSLGDLGWIQIATFVLTGLAIAAAAVGMRRALPSGRGAVTAWRSSPHSLRSSRRASCSHVDSPGCGGAAGWPTSLLPAWWRQPLSFSACATPSR